MPEPCTHLAPYLLGGSPHHQPSTPLLTSQTPDSDVDTPLPEPSTLNPDHAGKQGEKAKGGKEGATLLLLLLYSRTGPRRALRLKLSDTRVYEPEKRTRLGRRGQPRTLTSSSTQEVKEGKEGREGKDAKEGSRHALRRSRYTPARIWSRGPVMWAGRSRRRCFVAAHPSTLRPKAETRVPRPAALNSEPRI